MQSKLSAGRCQHRLGGSGRRLYLASVVTPEAAFASRQSHMSSFRLRGLRSGRTSGGRIGKHCPRQSRSEQCVNPPASGIADRHCPPPRVRRDTAPEQGRRTGLVRRPASLRPILQPPSSKPRISNPHPSRLIPRRRTRGSQPGGVISTSSRPKCNCRLMPPAPARPSITCANPPKLLAQTPESSS